LDNDKSSRPDLDDIPNSGGRFQQAFRRQILTESAPFEFKRRVLLPPEFVVLGWVRVYGLVYATMHGEIGLLIAVQIQSSNLHQPLDWTLVNPSSSHVPVNNDGLWPADLNRKNLQCLSGSRNRR
jgi:hypothetical protein